MYHSVNELARRAASEPRWVQALDANMIGGIPPATREVLQRVAVVGSSFEPGAHETIAMASDLFVALVLAAYAVTIFMLTVTLEGMR